LRPKARGSRWCMGVGWLAATKEARLLGIPASPGSALVAAANLIRIN
jgi:hypothetical protein